MNRFLKKKELNILGSVGRQWCALIGSRRHLGCWRELLTRAGPVRRNKKRRKEEGPREEFCT